MKKITTLLAILLWASAQIWAQKNTPQEKSIVNKEYDENGNLIQYDSTYVWQWNSDSTMNFSFDENFTFENGFPEIFGEFDADSIFQQIIPQFPGNFDFQELKELQKQFQEQSKQHSFGVPEINSPEQQEEWEELMKKQQKEKDELMKKWKKG